MCIRDSWNWGGEWPDAAPYYRTFWSGHFDIYCGDVNNSQSTLGTFGYCHTRADDWGDKSIDVADGAKCRELAKFAFIWNQKLGLSCPFLMLLCFYFNVKCTNGSIWTWNTYIFYLLPFSLFVLAGALWRRMRKSSPSFDMSLRRVKIDFSSLLDRELKTCFRAGDLGMPSV